MGVCRCGHFKFIHYCEEGECSDPDCKCKEYKWNMEADI